MFCFVWSRQFFYFLFRSRSSIKSISIFYIYKYKLRSQEKNYCDWVLFNRHKSMKYKWTNFDHFKIDINKSVYRFGWKMRFIFWMILRKMFASTNKIKINENCMNRIYWIGWHRIWDSLDVVRWREKSKTEATALTVIATANGQMTTKNQQHSAGSEPMYCIACIYLFYACGAPSVTMVVSVSFTLLQTLTRKKLDKKKKNDENMGANITH